MRKEKMITDLTQEEMLISNPAQKDMVRNHQVKRLQIQNRQKKWPQTQNHPPKLALMTGLEAKDKIISVREWAMALALIKREQLQILVTDRVSVMVPAPSNGKQILMLDIDRIKHMVQASIKKEQGQKLISNQQVKLVKVIISIQQCKRLDRLHLDRGSRSLNTKIKEGCDQTTTFERMNLLIFIVNSNKLNST